MFSCERCPYTTYNVGDFRNHRDRVYCCWKLHGNFKEKEIPICPKCDKELSRPDAVKRHLKTVHADELSHESSTESSIGVTVPTKKRTLTEATKKRIALRQHFKCANKPNKCLRGLENFKCPVWQISGSNRGIFTGKGYEIDHIIEFCITHDDSEDNLQALCEKCHATKTRRFMKKFMKRRAKKNISSSETSSDYSDDSDSSSSDSNSSSSDSNSSSSDSNSSSSDSDSSSNDSNNSSSDSNSSSSESEIKKSTKSSKTKKKNQLNHTRQKNQLNHTRQKNQLNHTRQKNQLNHTRQKNQLNHARQKNLQLIIKNDIVNKYVFTNLFID